MCTIGYNLPPSYISGKAAEIFNLGQSSLHWGLTPLKLELVWLETVSWNVWNKVRSGEVDVAGMGPDAGAIFGLIAPEFGELVFGEHFLAPRLLQYVEAFLGKELRLGYVHLRNARENYDTGWHRDVGGTNRDLPYDEEMALLNKPKTNFRWQLALIDDPCLWLVPWSQSRYRPSWTPTAASSGVWRKTSDRPFPTGCGSGGNAGWPCRRTESPTPRLPPHYLYSPPAFHPGYCSSSAARVSAS